jgi:hypothetical protein
VIDDIYIMTLLLKNVELFLRGITTLRLCLLNNKLMIMFLVVISDTTPSLNITFNCVISQIIIVVNVSVCMLCLVSVIHRYMQANTKSNILQFDIDQLIIREAKSSWYNLLVLGRYINHISYISDHIYK